MMPIETLVEIACSHFKREIRAHKFHDISVAKTYELGDKYPESQLIYIQPKEKQHV